jgi:hypothetical protein
MWQALYAESLFGPELRKTPRRLVNSFVERLLFQRLSVGCASYCDLQRSNRSRSDVEVADRPGADVGPCLRKQPLGGFVKAWFTVAAQVMRWCFAAVNSVEPPLSSTAGAGLERGWQLQQAPRTLARLGNWVLNNLERWLAGRDFVATVDRLGQEALIRPSRSVGAPTQKLDYAR